MAGMKRPKNVTAHAVAPPMVRAHAGSTTETIAVTQGSSAPNYVVPTATAATFEILDNIRVNTLGSQTNTNLFVGVDKSQGFYDLNFRSIETTGDLEIIETPTSLKIGLKPPTVTPPTYIESGQNTEISSNPRVYKGIVGSALEFRTLKAGSNIALTQTADSIEIALAFTPTTGDITGAANVGSSGQEIFRDKTGTLLNFRKLGSSSGHLSLSQDISGNQIILTVNENVFNIANMLGNIPQTRVTGLGPFAVGTDYNNLTNKPTIPTLLNDFANVDGTPTLNQVLQFDGSLWKPATLVQQNAYSAIKVNATTIPATSPTTDATFAAGSELVISANAVSRTITYNLKPTGITAGSFTNANITVDTYGRILSVANGTIGGTSNYVDPLTNAGDLLFRSSSATARLPIGGTNQILTVVAGLPAWRPLTLPGTVGTVKEVRMFEAPGIIVTGDPITTTGAYTIGLRPSGVTPGTFTNATVTVDNFGRVTGAISNPAGAGGVSVIAGPGITGGGPLTADVTVGLENLGVTFGTYANPTITVDEFGRITDIQDGGTNGSTGPVLPTTTTNNLSLATDIINVQGKVIGKQVFNTVTNKMMIATGTNPSAPWVDALGGSVITPS